MRQILLCSLLIFISFGLAVNDATAKRFGGGRGFGMMRAKNTFTQSPRTPKATSAAASRSVNSSRWRGALSGLLLGSLLTSLFMGHGFGGAILSWIVVGVTVYLIVNFLRRRRQRFD